MSIRRCSCAHKHNAGCGVHKAPSTAQAKRYIREAGADPNSLYNTFGESRGQTLRRYLFEQGAIGTAHGKKQTGAMMKKLEMVPARGKINEQVAQQAKVGRMSLDMQVVADWQFQNPFGFSIQGCFQWSTHAAPILQGFTGWYLSASRPDQVSEDRSGLKSRQLFRRAERSEDTRVNRG